MVGITSCEFKILRYIELNGPSTAYDMSKKRKPPPVVSDKTAYTLLPRLVKKGLLSVVTKKTGTRLKKEYSLTVLGLSRALTLTISEDWNPIIRKWAHLIPLVLGKWDFLVSAGVEKAAWKNLARAAVLVSETKYPPFKWGPSRDWNIIDRFYYYFYQMQIGLDDLKDQVRWVKACAKDSDITDYLTQQLTLMVEQHEVWLKEEKTMLQLLQKS